MAGSSEDIRRELLEQIVIKTSVAPRDIAQALADKEEDWRTYLPQIKKTALDLHAEGKLQFIRKKKIVSPENLKGVYRYGAPMAEAGD